jgi:glutamate carboxypeptidase
MVDAGRLALDLAGDLDRDLPSMLELVERLVSIDSGSHDRSGVEAVSETMAIALAERGFELRRTAVPGHADLVSASAGGGASPRVLVMGHSDTVWPLGTAAGWPFRREGDRVTGPGVGDMKASLVMACFALGALRARGLLDHVRVTLLLVPDEELGSVASRAAIERVCADADVCLGLEAASPGGGVVVERGAVGALVVRATGRTAHVTADDPRASSAVSALAALVAPLEALTRREAGVSVSVGILRGGSARQVVPGEAELQLDLRAPDRETAAQLEQDVREVLAAGAVPGVAIAVDGGFTRPPMPRSAGTDRLYELAATACASLGEPLFARSERGGSDASFAGALGTATLDGLGPICHDSCSRRESVEVSSISRRGAIFGALVAHAGAASGADGLT